MNRLRIKCERTLLIIAALISMGFAQLYASDATWKASPTDGAWENTNNWVELAAPGATGTTTNPDTATFSTASTTLTVVPDATRNLKNITFSTASVGAYILGTTGGNALLLSDGGAIQTTSAVNNNQIINAPLLLQGNGGAYAFTGGSTKTLSFYGSVGGAATASATNTLTLNGTGTGTCRIYGDIGDGSGGGKLALTKAGSGYWALSGANTYSGGTTLDAGALRAYHATAFGTGTIVINGGLIGGPTDATLRMTANNPQIWNGNFTAYAKYTKSFNIGTGSVLITTNITVTAAPNEWGAAFTVGGNISDGGQGYSVTVTGGGDAHPGAIIFTGNNTYSGGTIIKGSSLRVAQKSGIGSGPLTFAGGTLGTTSYNVPVTFDNNPPIILDGALSIAGGTGAINLGTGNVSLTGNRDISVSNGNLTIPGVIACSGGSGYGLAVKFGTYGFTLTLGGANTFDGGVTLLTTAADNKTAVTLAIKNLGVDGTASALGTGTLRMYFPDRTVQIDNTSGADGTLATANPQVWDSNFTFKGTSSLDMGNGSVSLGTMAGTNRTVTVTAKTLTIGGVIANGTTANMLTKAGAGILALSGANSYTGGTVVAAGTLSVETTGTLGTGAVTVAPGATLVLKNGEAIAGDAVVTLQNVGASYGKMNLSEGVVERVGSVVLGATTYTTPGMMFDAAGYPNYFLGTGQLKITAPTRTLIVVK